MRSRTSHFYRAAAASLAPDELRRHAYSHQELLDVIASGDVRAAERAMQPSTSRMPPGGLPMRSSPGRRRRSQCWLAESRHHRFQP